ncbi:hypothetical protein COV82_03915 [Candidatus Peregrinibacteria bacterium CG11_big_fil_rev_8_21_14_0_20_46_8]|nr:MAG: hypothetical protein COV82_03915 [Candidatus Peregrinibacteria bacterium CG11_big_fil_rev_8_21_14_0_20_46_8]
MIRIVAQSVMCLVVILNACSPLHAVPFQDESSHMNAHTVNADDTSEMSCCDIEDTEEGIALAGRSQPEQRRIVLLPNVLLEEQVGFYSTAPPLDNSRGQNPVVRGVSYFLIGSTIQRE